jgi:hypothetical protein
LNPNRSGEVVPEKVEDSDEVDDEKEMEEGNDNGSAVLSMAGNP